jgi:NADPH2:quinone reductase
VFAHHSGTGYDVILDYLWGYPTELLFRALTPSGADSPRKTRYVQIGQAAGASITFHAEAL